ncbi:MAG: S8 family serine peptidase [Chloroflexota bacterium]
MFSNRYSPPSFFKSIFVIVLLWVIFLAGSKIAYGDGPLPEPPPPDVETAAALQMLTTTGSDAPLAPPEPPLDSTDTLPITPLTDVSGPLINLDDFITDHRFSNINGSGFSVVILDTGIDLDHPYFGPDSDSNGVADRIVYHYDFADGDDDAGDVNGHGSNVSSIVAASYGAYKGMAPGANIIHLKVFQDGGAGAFGYVESALQWVVANANTYNIASVNMSLGDGGNYSSATPMTWYGIYDELAALAALKVIVASASGNSFYGYGSAPGVSYPAADPNSLSIGAVYDSNAGGFSYGGGAVVYVSGADRITPFSQRHSTLTTIFAPGAPIIGAGPDGGTVTMHGTSQASPHVAGIAALMQQLANQVIGRDLTPAEFSSLLNSSGVAINDGDDENDNVANTGLNFKRVDVLALGEAVLALDTTPPQVSQVNSNEDTGDGVLTDDETTTAAITQLLVTFDERLQDPAGDTQTDDVTNPNNYRLFAAGADSTFQSSGCAAAQGDDLDIAVGSVIYTGETHLATVEVNGGTPLPAGQYRLLVCGTTAIKDLAGNSLDGDGNGAGGDDFGRGFTVQAPANLAVSKTVDLANEPVPPGDPLTYTIVITNSGPGDAANVRIIDTLPAGVTGANLDTTSTVTAGHSLTFTIPAVVAANAPLNVSITNTVTYSHTSGNGHSSIAFTTPTSITQAIEVDPGAGSTQLTADTVLSVTIPAGVLPPATRQLIYTRLADPSVDPPPDFAGLAFDLKLVDGLGQEIPNPTFANPLTVVIQYDVTQLPAGVDGGELGLVFYDPGTGQWEEISVAGYDPEAHTVTVELDHFTEFALTGSGVESIYLPLVVKEN